MDDTTTMALVAASVAAVKALEKLLEALTKKIKSYNGTEEKKLTKADIDDIIEALEKAEETADKKCELMTSKLAEIQSILNDISKDESNNAANTEKAIDKITSILESIHVRQAVMESHMTNKNNS